jgi:hypothetical protein
MKKENYFATKKGDAGIGETFKDLVREFGLAVGSEITQPVIEALIDAALWRYETRVRAVLLRAGIDVPQTGPLTVASVRETVRRLTGLELSELTPEGIMRSVDAKLSAQLSERLGFVVSTVFDAQKAREEVKAQVLVSLADGHGSGVIKGRVLHELRTVATFTREGADRKKVMARVYQKRYRRQHVQRWE